MGLHDHHDRSRPSCRPCHIRPTSSTPGSSSTLTPSSTSTCHRRRPSRAPLVPTSESVALAASVLAMCCLAAFVPTPASSRIIRSSHPAPAERRSWAVSVHVGDGLFNVLDYGAVGDGKTDDTAALQKALDAASSAGGGTVVAPSGHTFLTFALAIRGSHTNFQIDGELLVNDDRSSWPGSVDFLTASHLTNVSLTGSGTVNGQGKVWWEHRDDFRPRLVYFEDCADVLVDGLTFKDSPNHNLELYTNNCEVSGVSILAPPSDGAGTISHNTDGIDVHGTPFYVHDSLISTGDDNVAVHANHVLVEDCQFGTGHGASIGSVGDATLYDITFNRVSFNGTTAGARIKTDTNTAGLVKDVTYSNLKMQDVGISAEINMFYGGGSGGKATMVVRNINFVNIYAQNSGAPGSFLCDSNSPCHSLNLTNFINDDTPGNFVCQHAFGEAENTKPKACF